MEDNEAKMRLWKEMEIKGLNKKKAQNLQIRHF